MRRFVGTELKEFEKEAVFPEEAPVDQSSLPINPGSGGLMRTRFVVDTFNIGSLHPVSALNGNAALVDSSGEPWNPDDIDYDQIALLYLIMMMEPIFHDAQQLFLKEGPLAQARQKRCTPAPGAPTKI